MNIFLKVYEIFWSSYLAEQPWRTTYVTSCTMTQELTLAVKYSEKQLF